MSVKLRMSHYYTSYPCYIIVVSFSPVCCPGGGQVLLLRRGRVATNTTTGTSQVRGHELEEKRCSEKDL